MYHIYQTEGIVLGGVDSGEANRYLYIFTKDLGLVGATAQGLRELKSKLRYSLQDFSYSYIELVDGKNGWRVVSAQSIDSYANILSNKGRQKNFTVIAKLCSLLKRLLNGEEENIRLFNEVITTFSFLKNETLTREDVFHTEIIAVMRILNHLGYWGENEILSPFLEGDMGDNNFTEQMSKIKSLAIREINKSLQETQL